MTLQSLLSRNNKISIGALVLTRIFIPVHDCHLLSVAPGTAQHKSTLCLDYLFAQQRDSFLTDILSDNPWSQLWIVDVLQGSGWPPNPGGEFQPETRNHMPGTAPRLWGLLSGSLCASVSLLGLQAGAWPSPADMSMFQVEITFHFFTNQFCTQCIL